jgi:hypothetical protein
MIPRSGHRFSDKIMFKQNMIPKSGYRFSDKIMFKQERWGAVRPRGASKGIPA